MDVDRITYLYPSSNEDSWRGYSQEDISMKMLKVVALGLISLISYGTSLASPAAIDSELILKNIEKMENFRNTDLSYELMYVTEEPGKEKKVGKYRIFAREKDKKFTAIILEPQSKRGEGYLSVDNTTWHYDPTSRKFLIHSRQESMGDSNLKADDIEGSFFTSQYQVTQSETGKLGKFDVYILSLKAKKDTVDTPFIKLWVRSDNYLILKQENYSLSNRLLDTTLSPNYFKVSDRFIPSQQIFIDNVNEGEKTQQTISNVSLDPIPDEVFTKGYLERNSK